MCLTEKKSELIASLQFACGCSASEAATVVVTCSVQGTKAPPEDPSTSDLTPCLEAEFNSQQREADEAAARALSTGSDASTRVLHEELLTASVSSR